MPNKKVASAIPEAKLRQYEKLVALFPDVERKGDTMPYTSHNGNMFSFLNPKGELALRLSAEDREKFIAKFKTKLAEQHGTVLKEFVHVPDALFAKTSEMKKYFVMSLAYVRTLKSKKK